MLGGCSAPPRRIGLTQVNPILQDNKKDVDSKRDIEHEKNWNILVIIIVDTNVIVIVEYLVFMTL